MDSFRDNSGIVEALEEERIQRAKWCAWWYENRPGGEGETNVGIVYQWVQVTTNDGKPCATFFLRQSEGQLVGLEVATLRKGCPPNPYEQGRAPMAGWQADDPAALPPSARLTPQEIDARVSEQEQMLRELDFDDYELSLALGEYRAMLERFRRGDTRVGDSWEIQEQPYMTTAMQLSASEKDAELIPVTGVVTIWVGDGDTRFKFRAGKDGFTVRGSKLGAVLMKLRQAGIQHISLNNLRRGL